MALPPLATGAINATNTCVLPATALPIIGAPGVCDQALPRAHAIAAAENGRKLVLSNSFMILNAPENLHVPWPHQGYAVSTAMVMRAGKPERIATMQKLGWRLPGSNATLHANTTRHAMKLFDCV